MEGKDNLISRKRRTYESSRSISPPPLRRKPSPANLSIPPLPPQPTEAQNRFEILSWNVNGVGPFLIPSVPKITSFFKQTSPQTPSQREKETYSLRNFLKRHNFPQILCLQEVKINPKDETTKRALERSANGDEGPGYMAHFSLPRDKYNAKGFGGKVHGVCTLIRDDVLSARKDISTRDVEWDLEGRVLTTEIPSFHLAIINGYWVNGTPNPYREPKTGDITGTRHDFKRKFHALMLDEVKSYEARGWHVVLIGDMNVARDARDGYPGLRLGVEHIRNRADFNAKFFYDEVGMKGTDTFRRLHNEKRGYSFHGEKAEEWGSSCDRVDLGIVSRGLVDNGVLVGAEIWESVVERGHSDHVPIGVVLDLGKFPDS